jgi:hypothetical protein
LRQQCAVRAQQLVFVKRAGSKPRDENLPDAGAVPQPHRVAAAVPTVEIADHRNAPRVGRPDGKAHARHAVDQHRVGAEARREIPVLPFGEQVDVELAEQWAKRIRVFRFLDWAAPIDPQQIGA